MRQTSRRSSPLIPFSSRRRKRRHSTDPNDACGAVPSPKKRATALEAYPSPSAIPPPAAASPSNSGFANDTGPRYIPAPGVIEEDEDFVVPGETPQDDYDSSDDNDVPIRLLDNFIIYDRTTQELVSPYHLLDNSLNDRKYGAAGSIQAYTAPDVEDELEEIDYPLLDPHMPSCHSVQLSTIIEFNYHHYNTSGSVPAFENKLYILTEYAWYILGSPSLEYYPVYSHFFINNQLLHLILSQCCSDPTTTYEDFPLVLDGLEEGHPIQRFMAHPLSPDSLPDLYSNDFVLYAKMTLGAVLDQLPSKDKHQWSTIPLIHFLCNSLNKFSPTSPTFLKTKSSHHKQTVVTPIVGRISVNVYNGHQLAIVGDIDNQDAGRGMAFVKESIAHEFDPETLEWGDATYHQVGSGLEMEMKYYDAVILDGVDYLAGDTVIVVPGSDSNKPRARNHKSDAAQSVNIYGSSYWFCRICYFYENSKGAFMHCQWFAHGCKTMLQETAHSQSLFMMNECDNVPLASIYKKCTVTMLVPDEDEPIEEHNSTVFHCGLVWDEDHTDFIDLPCQSEVNDIISLTPSYQQCYSCGLKRRQEELHKLRKIQHGFSNHGIRYHVHDFVYIYPLHGSLLCIGQIISIEGIPLDNPNVFIQLLERLTDHLDLDGGITPASGLCKDDRALVLTHHIQSFHPDQIEGVCYVKYLADADEIGQWVKNDDHFYLTFESDGISLLPIINPVKFCASCAEDHWNVLQQSQDLLHQHGPLIGLELFAGAGGLGTGMNMSKWVKTKYAIDNYKAAMTTYKHNHPSTQVYCQDVNLLLKYIIERDKGNNPAPLPQEIGEICTSLPKCGDVDFIFGGPPCQSFSLINHNRKADDIRSTLVCNMLSWVEHYQPAYFLLENVPGLLHFRLLAEQGKNGALIGGIEMGVVKFIQRSLIALGYQVRHKVLEAGQYGAPQGRQRVIFWGAKRGLQIPAFPIPTHCYPNGGKIFKQPIGQPLMPVIRSNNPECQDYRLAPLRAITVDDAIGDLPLFDWSNPHRFIRKSKADQRQINHHTTILGIPQFPAVTGGKWPGYPHPVAYPYLPMNWYQQWSRFGSADMPSGCNADQVTLHYTAMFSSLVVERTVNIPMKPLADHRSLPLELALSGARAQSRHSYFGRLDANGHFRTVMTQMTPTIKNTYLLHPSQKRILTVREGARVQGFPDWYDLRSTEETPSKIVQDQHRQIGNAVPVQLALALGKSLGDAVVQTRIQLKREGSPVV